MLLQRLATLAIFSLLLAACSSSTEPQPAGTNQNNQNDTLKREGPSIRRTYNSTRGGVQITAIYYDQNANRDSSGLFDEWIILESDTPVNTTGWMLNAGDDNQDYPLRPLLNRKLMIYTKSGPGFTSDTTQALGYGNWIWNNSDPDTAWVYDAAGNVVDSMSYDIK